MWHSKLSSEVSRVNVSLKTKKDEHRQKIRGEGTVVRAVVESDQEQNFSPTPLSLGQFNYIAF